MLSPVLVRSLGITTTVGDEGESESGGGVGVGVGVEVTERARGDNSFFLLGDNSVVFNCNCNLDDRCCCCCLLSSSFFVDNKLTATGGADIEWEGVGRAELLLTRCGASPNPSPDPDPEPDPDPDPDPNPDPVRAEPAPKMGLGLGLGVVDDDEGSGLGLVLRASKGRCDVDTEPTPPRPSLEERVGDDGVDVGAGVGEGLSTGRIALDDDALRCLIPDDPVDGLIARGAI